MKSLTKHSFADMYSLLPVTQQKQVEKKTRAYFDSLDKAIADILSPTIGKTEDQFLVKDEYIHLYGVGTTSQDAMDDYRSVIISYYETLEEDVDELDDRLKKQLEFLRQIFFRVQGIF